MATPERYSPVWRSSPQPPVPPRRGWLGPLSSILRLARWRTRSTRGLLAVAWLGMLAAVMIVAAGPLYSTVAMTAGLRTVLLANPQNRSVIVQATTQQINAALLANITRSIDQEVQQYLGPYVGPLHLSLDIPWQKVIARDGRRLSPAIDNLALVTQPIQQAAQHLTLVEGNLPPALTPAQARRQVTATGASLAIALSQQEAQRWQVHVGESLAIQLVYNFPGLPGNVPFELRRVRTLTLQVTGIFANQYHGLSLDEDPFWHQEAFLSADHQGIGLNGEGADYTALADTTTVITVLDRFYQQLQGENNPVPLTMQPVLCWLYELQPAQITIDQLSAITSGVHSLQLDVANRSAEESPDALTQEPFVMGTTAFLPSDILTQYQSRLALVRIPLMAVLVLITALLLFFVSMIAELLVDRQSEAIAVLRSRGLSRSQILGMFALQGLALSILALLMGLVGSGLLVQLLAARLLPATSPSVPSLVVEDWPALLPSLGWPAVMTTLTGLAALLGALWRPLRSNIVSLRREIARTTQRPLWRRLHLDIVALLLMLAGYGLSAYFVNSNVLDARLRLLLLSPLSLLGAVCLLLAAILLFLRLLPRLLMLASKLAARRRGAAPLLAVAHLARAPQQPARMTLLLALATAFAVFSLVFLSSQAQRAIDVSIYTVGADFSGPLAFPGRLDDLSDLTAQYRRLPGVLAASLGFATTASAGGTLQLPIALRAVDSATFTQAALWPRQGSDPALPTLMALLQTRRGWGEAHHLVPAIIDEAAAQSLHLSTGSTLVLTVTATPSSPPIETSFVVVGQVQAMPTVLSSPQGNVANGVPAGGVLVDYQTYATIFEGPALAAGSDLLPLNYVWLRTSESASALLRLRSLLTSSDVELTQVLDRRTLLEELRYEPLYLDLLGILTCGVIAALVLALVGNLLASWQSTRRRLLQFALLRALGSSRRQLAAMLAWEQGLIYVGAIVLGTFFGLVLAWLVVPALIFTGAPSGGPGSDLGGTALYVSQRVPAVQLVFPPALLVLLAGLVMICLLALTMTVSLVTRLTVARTLRLNED
ncbi:FtsX-like permease family protein [Thermogemmatispora sp.]|uniref:FtsX-like permease family protein n=1 Tax=Thermogemmatispora sp. TaxID=1968838 RepID=UPI001DB73DD1|nr:ABC transporter permease [Thermogemmatispora sp.]MBX5450383.1 FtsX-like permease family protein [Thermogemmatispora sp.]